MIEIEPAMLSMFLGIVLSIVALGKIIYTPLKKITDKNKYIEEGIQILLRLRLEKEFEKVEKQGYVTLEGRKWIQQIHDAYAALGGNSYGTMIFEKAMALPLEKAEENVQ